MPAGRLPPWIAPAAGDLAAANEVRRVLRAQRLGTVCESARCPNRDGCFASGTATFLILGGVCTRRCGFCAVARGTPAPPDPREPLAVARAVRALGLRHAVVTSVTRDDLPDGGAGAFAATVRAIRGPRPQPASPSRGEGREGVETEPAALVEVLVPDFAGSEAALATVLAAGPAVLDHNVETVPRLYGTVRPGAVYERSLRLLARARALAPGVPAKSGVMAGLGEEPAELVAVMRDLASVGVSSLTIGQYLRPRRDALPVARYLEPREFEELAAAGREAGIAQVVAGPLVRSSWRAGETHAALVRRAG